MSTASEEGENQRLEFLLCIAEVVVVSPSLTKWAGQLDSLGMCIKYMRKIIVVLQRYFIFL